MTLTEPPARPYHPRSSHEGMGPMPPRPEAAAAAAWWAEQLATLPHHDVGAPLRTALANVTTAHGRRQRTREQIDAFRTALADRIEQHLAKYCWLPDEPDFGSYMRAVVVDPVPDDVLTDAAERAGFRLTSFDLPMRTVMWIDPGIVKVAAGHGAESVVIWATPTTATTGEMTS